jgi:putative IMPACT (imprinted ancient) family translation regulator
MSAPIESYTTLAGPFRYEPDKIKGSRFIACIAPAETESEAQAFIQSIRGR